MKRLAVVALVWSMFGAAAAPAETRRGRVWRISVGLLAGAVAADAHSSWGRIEVNPLLRGPDGRFAARGAAVKGSLLGATVLTQYLLLRRAPKAEPYAAAAKFAVASALAGVAAHNYALPRGSR